MKSKVFIIIIIINMPGDYRLGEENPHLVFKCRKWKLPRGGREKRLEDKKIIIGTDIEADRVRQDERTFIYRLSTSFRENLNFTTHQ